MTQDRKTGNFQTGDGLSFRADFSVNMGISAANSGGVL